MTSSPPLPAAKPDSTAIPVQLSAQEFAALILPPLSVPKRGPQCKIGSHKPFHYLLQVLYTGRPWQDLPIDPGPEGKAELPDTGVFKLLARWAEEGSLERAFLASLHPRDEAQKRALSLLHGDGSNPVAKKGGRVLATGATNTRRARKCSP
jgi:transposase